MAKAKTYKWPRIVWTKSNAGSWRCSSCRNSASFRLNSRRSPLPDERRCLVNGLISIRELFRMPQSPALVLHHCLDLMLYLCHRRAKMLVGLLDWYTHLTFRYFRKLLQFDFNFWAPFRTPEFEYSTNIRCDLTVSPEALMMMRRMHNKEFSMKLDRCTLCYCDNINIRKKPTLFMMKSLKSAALFNHTRE